MTTSKNTVRVYACGGTGINIAKHFSSKKNQSLAFATIDPVFVDTSASNLRDMVSPEHTYLIEGLDGSGKVRASNAKVIDESIVDILTKHKPGDLNIVVCSGSGGSGSTLSPLLTSELMRQKQNVIVLMVISKDSTIEVSNAVKTFKSFEAISKMNKVPCVMVPYTNDQERNDREAVNEVVRQDMIKLSALFSGNNEELDSADLSNWLNYTKVTNEVARVTLLDMEDGVIQERQRGRVLTAATLAVRNMDTKLGTMAEYRCIGFVGDDNSKALDLKEATHFMIVEGVIGDEFNAIEASLEEYHEHSRARRRSAIEIVGDDDQIENNGLVL